MKITAADIGLKLEDEARAMLAFAHDRRHYVHPRKGQGPETTYPAALTRRMKLPSWETTIKITYAVDVVDGVAWRHLAITISVSGHITTAAVRAGQAELVRLCEPIVRLFFPFADEVQTTFRACEPVPVLDPSTDGAGNVSLRTPVALHFVIPHDDNLDGYDVDEPTDEDIALAHLHRALAAASTSAPNVRARELVEEYTRRLLELGPDGEG